VKGLDAGGCGDGRVCAVRFRTGEKEARGLLRHVTNHLATAENDFDKGEDSASKRMIEIARSIRRAVIVKRD